MACIELVGRIAADSLLGHEEVLARVLAVDHGHARGAGCDRRLPAVVALDPDPDLAAAGEADVPGLVVGDAVEQQLRRSARQHALGLLDDRALDAAARDGARHLTARADCEFRAQRAWSGQARAHDGGQCHVVAARAPEVCGAERFVVHALC